MIDGMWLCRSSFFEFFSRSGFEHWSDGEPRRREEGYCLLAKRFENNLALRWESRTAPPTARQNLREESGCSLLSDTFPSSSATFTVLDAG
jgi:hypothetical protein